MLQKGFKRLTAIQKTQLKSTAEKREGRKTREEHNTAAEMKLKQQCISQSFIGEGGL